MQHLSPQICKRLEALGLTSEYGFWFALPGRMLESGEPKSYVLDEHYEVIHESNESAYYAEKMFPAYTIADILLNADNAKKLWVSKKEVRVSYSGYCLDDECNTDEKIDEAYRLEYWEYKTHELLDLHLSGTNIEPHLLEAIESNKLTTPL